MRKDFKITVMKKSFLPRWLFTPIPFTHRSEKGSRKAFTLIELLLGVAIVGTLLSVGVPIFTNTLYKARVNHAISKVALMGQKIDDFLVDNGRLPVDLAEIGNPNATDPWGNPYEYLPMLGMDKTEIEGKWRKDRFLIPLNTDFDLYSMGKDGLTNAPLTAEASWDDIVRANNGGYVGLGHKY